MGTVFAILLFGVLVLIIWISYRLFMKGFTAEEKVAALLPSNFKPDCFHRKGDTYIGYEKGTNRLVLVDWPHAKVLAPEDVHSLKPVDDSMLGLTHRWLAINVPDPTFGEYRIWFQFSPASRNAWHVRIAEICKK
jgi:hypothetical protein